MQFFALILISVSVTISSISSFLWKLILAFIMSKRAKSDSVPAPKKIKAHWSMGLLTSLKDPDLFVQSDDLVTVIKDKYPKAEFHYLVIAKENITSLVAVKPSHLSLLQHMDNVGCALAEKHKDKTFKIGYHAQPSMVRLHLHVISDDMNSECLKTKKHWNSFTTEFLLDSKSICKQLEESKNISLPSADKCKELINKPLVCNKCTYIPKNIPDLKKHILTHKKS